MNPRDAAAEYTSQPAQFGPDDQATRLAEFDAFLAGHKHATDELRPVLEDVLNRVRATRSAPWMTLSRIEHLIFAALNPPEES